MLHLRGLKVSLRAHELREKALAELELTLEDIEDPVLYVLQAHLFIEQLLGRVITALLPRGTELLESTQWSFHQKAVMVHALDILPAGIYPSLRSFNSLRNRLAHRLRYEVTSEDVKALLRDLPNSSNLLDATERHPIKGLQGTAIALLGSICTIAIAYENLEPEAPQGDA